jgi:hypothetical protein
MEAEAAPASAIYLRRLFPFPAFFPAPGKTVHGSDTLSNAATLWGHFGVKSVGHVFEQVPAISPG